METFKAWKELIKAVKGISSAIEGEDSKGGSCEVDNINYINEEERILFNRNLDNTKLAFDAATGPTSMQKVGDLFNQEGIDIINSMLPILVNNQERYWDVYFFIKDAPTGNVAQPIVKLMYNGVDNLFAMKCGGYVARISDKFTLDTAMSQGGVA